MVNLARRIPQRDGRAGGSQVRQGLFRAACVAASMAFCSAACADEVLDPTRPPQATQAQPSGEAARPILQSVMISPSRRSAIIEGHLVELGQMYGEAKLTRITESEVALVRGHETQVLRLFPDVEKKAVVAPQDAPPASHKKPRVRSQR